MNSPSRVISFVNAAHFIDHYAMLSFAAAVIIIGPALGMAYSELLPYATRGFVAFAAGRPGPPGAPPPHDADLLHRHRRGHDLGRLRADAAATRHGAAGNRPVR